MLLPSFHGISEHQLMISRLEMLEGAKVISDRASKSYNQKWLTGLRKLRVAKVEKVLLVDRVIRVDNLIDKLSR